jgi:hypothetical protein
MSEWRPIETYPYVEATRQNWYLGRGPRVVFRDKDGKCSCGFAMKGPRGDTAFVMDLWSMLTPTHWMPIPELIAREEV